MFTGARKKKGNGLAAGCQLFYRKIYRYFLQCRKDKLFEALRVNLSPTSNHFTFVLFERVVGRAGRWHCVTFSAGASFGWSGGAMVLGKLPVPVFLTSLANSGPRAYCACRRCGWRLFDYLFSHLSVLFFLPLSGRPPDIG